MFKLLTGFTGIMLLIVSVIGTIDTFLNFEAWKLLWIIAGFIVGALGFVWALNDLKRFVNTYLRRKV